MIVKQYNMISIDNSTMLDYAQKHSIECFEVSEKYVKSLEIKLFVHAKYIRKVFNRSYKLYYLHIIGNQKHPYVFSRYGEYRPKIINGIYENSSDAVFCLLSSSYDSPFSADIYWAGIIRHFTIVLAFVGILLLGIYSLWNGKFRDFHDTFAYVIFLVLSAIVPFVCSIPWLLNCVKEIQYIKKYLCLLKACQLGNDVLSTKKTPSELKSD